MESETSLSGKTRSTSRLVSLVTCGHGAANVPLQDINNAIVELRDDDVPSQLLPAVVDTVVHGTADVPHRMPIMSSMEIFMNFCQ